jgi:hypothetical protein
VTEVDPDRAASVIVLYLDGRARVMYLAMPMPMPKKRKKKEVVNQGFEPIFQAHS